MKIIKNFRRNFAIFLITIGFSYPSCALICPKGIGGCISPGKCLLFVDADDNLICDYVYPPESIGEGEITNNVLADTVSDFSLDKPSTTENISSSMHHDTLSVGSGIAVQMQSLMVGVSFFLLFTMVFSMVVRKMHPGIWSDRLFIPLAITWLPSLCASLICTAIIFEEELPSLVFSLMYCIIGVLIAGYLWMTGAVTQKIAKIMAVCGTAVGFIFISPIMPLEIGWVFGVLTGASLPVFSMVVLCFLLVSTILFGRIFCGNICPVGALQELVYGIPGRKLVINQTILPEMVRIGVFVLITVAFMYNFDLMSLTGLYDLFSLQLTGGFLIAMVLIICAIFVYRPICRFICPYGLIFSVLAECSVFKLNRTESCSDCKRCERNCPTGASKVRSKRECYYCGKCTDICHGDAGIRYSR